MNITAYKTSGFQISPCASPVSRKTSIILCLS